MKKTCLFLSAVLIGVGMMVSCKSENGQPAYKNPELSVEKRVNDLIKRMTLDEKILQLNQYSAGKIDNPNNINEITKQLPPGIGSVIYHNEDPTLRNTLQRKAMEETRLGIPIIFAYDVIHGFRTTFPIPLAQAASWNTDLVTEACSIAAREAWLAGIDWVFSPMIDVARDGRWGRIAEGYGEDPYTTARFAVAAVKGYQGDDMKKEGKVVATLKHYAGYGACDGGRDYGYTEVSRQTLWDTYLPPYEAAVKAGATTVMSAFTNLSGTPVTMSHYMLTEILKEKWEHKGYVVSDWGAIGQLIAQGAAADSIDAAQKAFDAGLEMDMCSDCYGKFLKKLVEEKKISEKKIDEAVKRILRVKFEKGLFENPYIPETTEEERFLLPESKALAEKLAEEVIVLLKNKNDILPLKQKNIAIVGPMVKNDYDVLGCWKAHGMPENVETIWQGLEKEFAGKATLNYSRGCLIDTVPPMWRVEGYNNEYAEAVSMARRSDVVVLFLGESKWFTGEDAIRSTIALPQMQIGLLKELYKTGKPIVLVLASGRAVELGPLEPMCDAIVEMWHPGICAGSPIAGVLSGRVNPSGKLPLTFPYSSGQMPIYYNQRAGARPAQGKYEDIPTTPLFEFGHGLSYSTFEYSDLRASTTTVKRDGKLTVEVDVTNSSDRDGAEVVHWYVTDQVCKITRPTKELRFFEKRMLKAGEKQTFKFEIEPLRDLGFIDSDGNHFVESGEYIIRVKDKELKINVED